VEPIVPFRWDVSRREQLGRIAEGVQVETYPGFEDDLVTCCARVLALGGDSDFVFVGRSPECLFDFLSGALATTSWSNRLELLPMSTRWEAWPKRPDRVAFRANLAAAGLAPQTLERHPRRVALVDLADTGATLGDVVALVREWAEDGASRWRAVAPRLRIVGVTWQEKSSPHTWRWSQHSDWAGWLAPGAVKNVSIPGTLLQFLTTDAPKIAAAFTPDRWRDPSAALPLRDEQARRGLALALRLYDLGASGRGRAQLAAGLARQPAMRSAWLRSLVLELRGTSRSRG
jgi:hypothetical protein